MSAGAQRVRTPRRRRACASLSLAHATGPASERYERTVLSLGHFKDSDIGFYLLMYFCSISFKSSYFRNIYDSFIKVSFTCQNSLS